MCIGLLLGLTFANTFMSFHKQNWLANCLPEIKPKMFRRYADECFTLFDDKSKSNKFLQYLNRKHTNITFTIEYEANKKLPFLNISVNLSNKFTTSVYRKI